MVWQDFMFGCGNYPTWPALLESIKKEAIENVSRLRHHPSIVIYAGNNEDYQVQEQEGLTYNYEDQDRDHWMTTDFPARYIYEELLPRVVQEYSPSVFYHPGSPWGDGKISSDPTVGDLHQWNGQYNLHSALIEYHQTEYIYSLARYAREVSNIRHHRRTIQQ
jgi:beta-mannosidase